VNFGVDRTVCLVRPEAFGSEVDGPSYCCDDGDGRHGPERSDPIVLEMSEALTLRAIRTIGIRRQFRRLV
jgi:hypothetical protein